jgi:hypothetical protein
MWEILGLLLAAGIVFTRSGASPELDAAAFENPPEEAPESLLPAAMVAGESFRVVAPVRSDGLMRHYVVESPFGTFDAYGRGQLEVRIHEIEALAQIAKMSKLEVVARGVGSGIDADVHTIAKAAEHPVDTIAEIPTGVTHLFEGYIARGKEGVEEVKRANAGMSTISLGSHDALRQEKDAARHYADEYFKVSAAERRWYKTLGVDPYTSNKVLRQTIHRNALIDATAQFGLRFARLPALPGLGFARQAMEAIYTEDPAVIRGRQRVTLAGYGLEKTEIQRWQDSLLFSPTQQVLLLSAAEALAGVAGRAELFRHAADLTSPTEAQVYLRSVGLLLLVHRQNQVESLLPATHLPAARLADGRVVVCGAFDSVYWTKKVADGIQDIGQSLRIEDVIAPELWLEGSVSERARVELMRRGWEIHESIDELPIT